MREGPHLSPCWHTVVNHKAGVTINTQPYNT